MTPETIKKNAKITEHKNSTARITEVRASIEVGYSIRVDTFQYEHSRGVSDDVAKHVREGLVRAVFADQRRALYEALDELERETYFSSPKQHEAMKKVMEAARYQPDFEILVDGEKRS